MYVLYSPLQSFDLILSRFIAELGHNADRAEAHSSRLEEAGRTSWFPRF